MKHLLLALSFLGVALGTYSQTDSKSKLEDFLGNIGQFGTRYPQEKVYLHLDNTGYFMGERLWFKAYVLRDDKQALSDMSRVLYVELLNPSGEVVKSEKLKIVKGEADGYINLIFLPVSGFYEIRAYTSYMLNWGEAAMFSRVFPILNKPEKEGDYSDRRMDEFSALTRLPDYREQVDEGKKKMNVEFYPEGGHLVSGLENHVAFAITDEDGRHFESKGYLEDGGQAKCDVRTIREGRGTFVCKPQGGKLTLHLVDKDGKERSFRLPDAEQDGCAMHVDALSADSITVRMSVTSAFRSQQLGLVAMNKGRVMRFDVLTANDVATTRMSKSQLGDGVSQLSVVDQQGQILATRMVFVNQGSKAEPISVTMEEEYLKPYGKITLKAKTLPNSHFSMSVCDYFSRVDGWQANLASWLLLSSDLKGYIENAKYYVEADDAEHRLAADLLMMVQGWQRYDLQQMGSPDKFVLEHPLERNLFFEGKLLKKNKFSKNLVNDVTLWATYMTDENNPTDSVVFEDFYVTGKNGNFQFKSPDFYGVRDVVFRPEKDGKIAEYNFMFNRGYEPLSRFVSRRELCSIPIDAPCFINEWSDPDTVLSMTQRVFLLDQVVVREKGNSPAARYWKAVTKAISKSSIYYDCAKEYEKLRDKGEQYVDLLKWLEKRNPYFSGGWPTEEGDLRQYSASISHRVVYPRDGMAYKRRPIVWILNNAFNCITFAPPKVSEESILTGALGMSTLPRELRYVKSIYISEDPEAWKSYVTIPDLESSNPVTIFVFRGSGYNNWESMRKGIRTIHLQGYQIPRTFKSPKYKRIPTLPDFRRTLYWNPNVKTDSKGEATIAFYNNRDCRQIVISAEGLGSNGQPMVYDDGCKD